MEKIKISEIGKEDRYITIGDWQDSNTTVTSDPTVYSYSYTTHKMDNYPISSPFTNNDSLEYSVFKQRVFERRPLSIHEILAFGRREFFSTINLPIKSDNGFGTFNMPVSNSFNINQYDIVKYSSFTL